MEVQIPGALCIAARRALVACGTRMGSVVLLRASTLEILVRHNALRTSNSTNGLMPCRACCQPWH